MPKKSINPVPIDGRPGGNILTKAPSAKEDGEKCEKLNKQNLNYFSPLSSEYEENSLTLHAIQTVRYKLEEDRDIEHESDRLISKRRIKPERE